jgi:hypothetical protein
VSDRQALLDLGGRVEDRETLPGVLGEQTEDLGLRADVDPAAGLVQEHHPGAGRQDLADHDLLLVPTGEGADGQGRVRRLDGDLLDHPRRERLLLRAGKEPAPQELADARQGEVLGHTHGLHQAVTLTVLGHQADTHLEALTQALAP